MLCSPQTGYEELNMTNITDIIEGIAQTDHKPHCFNMSEK